MDVDEFIRSVSSAEVLITEESLNLILLMKGSTPKKELPFSSAERGGPWTEEFFKDLSNASQHGYYPGNQPYSKTAPTLLNTSIPFQINYGKSRIIYIKSVFLINNTSSQFSSVSLLNSEGKISRLENRTYLGYQLYEAVFNPKVKMQSNKIVPIDEPPFSVQQQSTASILVQQSFSPRQQPLRQSALLQGQKTIGANTTITMQNVPWNFVVGFKFKTL